MDSLAGPEPCRGRAFAWSLPLWRRVAHTIWRWSQSVATVAAILIEFSPCVPFVPLTALCVPVHSGARCVPVQLSARAHACQFGHGAPIPMVVRKNEARETAMVGHGTRTRRSVALGGIWCPVLPRSTSVAPKRTQPARKGSASRDPTPGERYTTARRCRLRGGRQCDTRRTSRDWQRRA